jgi:hypothetical protein
MKEVSAVFKIIGGPNDGETVRLPAWWDGRGHRPVPHLHLAPPSEAPVLYSERAEETMQEAIATYTYHLHIWDDAWKRWYDYRAEPQTP